MKYHKPPVYPKAYIKDPNEIGINIHLDSSGCLGIEKIREINKNYNDILDGHLYCPYCDPIHRAELYYNNKRGYLARKPDSSHSFSCKYYGKSTSESSSNGHTHHKEITDKNSKDVKKNALNILNRIIKRRKEYNAHVKSGSSDDGHSHGDGHTVSTKTKNTGYWYLHWCHDFDPSDDNQDCALLGLIKYKKIHYYSFPYKGRNIHARLITVEKGKKHCTIHDTDWLGDEDWDISDDKEFAKKKKDLPLTKCPKKFVALCTIKRGKGRYKNKMFKNLKDVKDNITFI